MKLQHSSELSAAAAPYFGCYKHGVFMASLIKGVCFFIFISFANCVFAQDVTFDNQGEVEGAAYLTLQVKYPTVKTTMDFCAAESPKFSSRSQSVIQSWTNRNGKYLALIPIMRSEMKSISISQGMLKEWNEFENSTQSVVAANSGVLVGQIKAYPAGEMRLQFCKNLADAIDKGALDFSREDPKIYKFLNQLLASSKK